MATTSVPVLRVQIYHWQNIISLAEDLRIFVSNTIPNIPKLLASNVFVVRKVIVISQIL